MGGVLVGAAVLKELTMVDTIVDAPDQLLSTAADEAKRWLAFPDFGRAEMKMVLREEFATDWSSNALKEAAHLWKVQSNPESIAAVKKVLEGLSKGKKKAKL